MRLLVFSFLFMFSTVLCAQQPDSAKMAVLGSKLQEYYEALKHESLQVQKQECDFLIESTTDSLIRQFVTLDIFAHYLDSPMMGSENVAVYIFDKWLADKTVRMRSDADYMAAMVYADFNRQSLLGEKAPGLIMESSAGSQVELFCPGSGEGRYSVLYFYDTDCAKCKIETIFLKNLFANIDYPVDLYAIYAGDNRTSWDEYIRDRFNAGPSRITHLWDPDLDSDFQRKYGILQTPRIFLVAPDKTIIGRGLDVNALETLLDSIFAERNLQYGGQESIDLYDGIFASSNGKPTEKQVKGIADYIYDRTLARGDTLMFRQMAGDYLYYLASHSGEGYKEGLRYHIDKNISEPVWNSQDDSLKIIGFAEIMDDLLSKSPPGTHIPSIKVPATLHTWKGGREVIISLDNLKGKTNVIIFYTEGCEVCSAEKDAAIQLLARGKDRTLPKSERKAIRNIEVLMVNVDKIFSTDPGLATQLMDSFDLSSLPFIIITDSKAIVLSRYSTLLQ